MLVLYVSIPLALCIGTSQYGFNKKVLPLYRRFADLSQTMFMALDNYQVNATYVTEDHYPWIAQLVHSRSANYPHMCTAVCIDVRIFITAAVCIHRLKVQYTTILYQYRRLPALAFVVPENGSKQAYDDIGFIVVDDTSIEDTQNEWHKVDLFDTTNRTDDEFQWFADLFHTNEINHIVVGYAIPKILRSLITADRLYHLSELPVVVNINLCASILTFNNLINGFYVPCYHSCAIEEFRAKANICGRYHGVDGGAVYNVNTKKLLGVVTWGTHSTLNELPVGFSVPNSENFFKDYDCAKRIRNDNKSVVQEGYYQSICVD